MSIEADLRARVNVIGCDGNFMYQAVREQAAALLRDETAEYVSRKEVRLKPTVRTASGMADRVPILTWYSTSRVKRLLLSKPSGSKPRANRGKSRGGSTTLHINIGNPDWISANAAESGAK